MTFKACILFKCVLISICLKFSNSCLNITRIVVSCKFHNMHGHQNRSSCKTCKLPTNNKTKQSKPPESSSVSNSHEMEHLLGTGELLQLVPLIKSTPLAGRLFALNTRNFSPPRAVQFHLGQDFWKTSARTVIIAAKAPANNRLIMQRNALFLCSHSQNWVKISPCRSRVGFIFHQKSPGHDAKCS